MNNAYRISVTDGEISVDYLNHEVTVGKRILPAASVIPGLSNNWWTANWSGDGWNLDLDCGAQRFNGVTTTRRIREALAVAGLNSVEIKTIISLAKKHKHFSVARH